ncbi:MAG: TetR/AcrR family transcriptional regulator [Parvularculaceae bacterium]
METKDRLRNAAIVLFADQGFHATTIGNIESAAGFAQRAGTFYRHFPSKQAIFDDCVRKLVDIADRAFDPTDTLLLNDPRAELITIAQTMIKVARDNRSIRKLIRKNVGEQPLILNTLNEINQWFFTKKLALWVAEKLAAADSKADPMMMAALIFGPILYHMIQADIDAYSFGIDERHFLKNWADHWSAVLTPKRN